MQRSTLSLNDMVSLLDASDAIHLIEKLLDVFTGSTDFVSGSILAELYKIENVIAHASPLFRPEEQDVDDNFSETEFGRIFEDTKLSNEDKAKKLLGINSLQA